MTLAQAKKRVREAGYRLDWNHAIAEYTVVVVGNRSADYFTDDRDDAVQTAIAMGAGFADRQIWNGTR